MTTSEKWEVGLLIAVVVVLLLLWRRNSVIGVPTSLNLPSLGNLNADPNVSGVNPGLNVNVSLSPLGDAPFADPNAIPFLGQYSCGCGITS